MYEIEFLRPTFSPFSSTKNRANNTFNCVMVKPVMFENLYRSESERSAISRSVMVLVSENWWHVRWGSLPFVECWKRLRRSHSFHSFDPYFLVFHEAQSLRLSIQHIDQTWWSPSVWSPAHGCPSWRVSSAICLNRNSTMGTTLNLEFPYSLIISVFKSTFFSSFNRAQSWFQKQLTTVKFIRFRESCVARGYLKNVDHGVLQVERQHM